MSRTTIDKVIEVLKKEEEVIRTELAEVKRSVRGLQRDLERIRAGLAGLGGRSRQGKKRDHQRPTAQEVADLVAEVLHERGPTQEQDLERDVASRLEGRGQSQDGLHEEFVKALQDQRFVSNLSGWKLAEHTVKAPDFQMEMAGG